MSLIYEEYIQLIDHLEETDIIVEFRRVKEIEENFTTKENVEKTYLTKSEVHEIFSYIDDLEQRIDNDYKIMELMDLHENHRGALGLVDLRDKIKKVESIYQFNIMAFNEEKNKYALDFVGLANLGNAEQLKVIEKIENMSKVIASASKENLELHRKKYLQLVTHLNETIQKLQLAQ